MLRALLFTFAAAVLAQSQEDDYENPLTAFDSDPDGDGDDDLAERISVFASGPVCQACWDHLVDPNSGAKTKNFATCFKVVDEVCGGEDNDRYAFCSGLARMKREYPDMPRGLAHVIELEHWKHQHCEWATHQPAGGQVSRGRMLKEEI